MLQHAMQVVQGSGTLTGTKQANGRAQHTMMYVSSLLGTA
jgi:hypothetical protein